MKRALHFIKMIRAWMGAVTMFTLAMGLSGFGLSSASAKTPSLTEIRKDLKEGDLYQARKKAQKFLVRRQGDPEAQKLMAEIIDREIARHKEVMSFNAKEELPADARDEEIKTWLERGRALMDLKRYNEAVLAVEKALFYDAQNTKASKLMDEIRLKAIQDGKQDVLIRQEMARSEIKERVLLYLDQTQNYIASGRLGAARMTTDKILLLEPENKKALELQKKIQKKLEVENRPVSSADTERSSKSDIKGSL